MQEARFLERRPPPVLYDSRNRDQPAVIDPLIRLIISQPPRVPQRAPAL
jgi:hypothetical protein